MGWIAGCVLLFLGLAGMLFSAHLRSLRFFDRPSVARLRHFDAVLDALKWLLVAGGLAILVWRSPAAGAATAAVLALLWIYRRFIRSVAFQTRLVRRDFEALRRGRPGLPHEEILYELAWRRHPRWGPELIDQMVKDYPTIKRFSVMVVRMERGFRGFETNLKRR